MKVGLSLANLLLGSLIDPQPIIDSALAGSLISITAKILGGGAVLIYQIPRLLLYQRMMMLESG